MQNAKDSFYEMLRGRLAALNPDRTVVVRGVTRPGLVVDENETQSVATLPDCFHVRWMQAEVDSNGCLPVVTLGCEISYATAGSSLFGGLDRGRALAAMDAELSSAVTGQPQNAPKSSYTGLIANGMVMPMATKIWWSDVRFLAVKVTADQILRTATLEVMSLQEPGEL